MKVFGGTRVTRVVSTLAVAALTVGITAALGAPVAAAADTSGVSPVVQRSATGVTADALPTVQINGVAWDQAIVGDTVYAGGQFTSARPAGAAAGTNETPRSNLLSYNITTGVMNAGFAPTVNGRVRTLATSPDGKRLYVGGAFTSVNGVDRYRIAAFDTATGNLITSFAPVIGSDVFAITATNTTVYLGGWFKSVNGVARTRLAAVSASNGALLGWAPTADNTVNSLALTADGAKVFAAGTFANLNGTFNPGLGSFSATDGTLIPVAATSTVQNFGDSAGFYSVKVAGSTVYATAFWFGGSGNFEGMLAMDAGTGAIKTLADCHGDTYDVSPLGDTVYTVSHHHYCSNIGGFPDTNPRDRWQRANAFTAAVTGTVQPNGQGGYYNFAGQPSPSVVNWFPDVAVGSYTGQSQGGWTTESNGTYLVQGGEFPMINNKAQQGLVRFAIPSASTNLQGPRLSGTDTAPTLTAVGDTKVRVNWRSNYDRDDQLLTYRIYRVGTTAPIFTTTATSQFWNRPGLTFTDTGLTKGQTYQYRVVALDPNGNQTSSTNVSIVAGSGTVDETAYSQQVVADGANHYWRLDQPAGTATAVDWAGSDDLALSSGVTNGAGGAIQGSTDPAATFDGTANGTSTTATGVTAPDTFTVEAWFKTTTTAGGRIVGYGGSPTGLSGSYDRQVYMTNDGKIIFGVYPGSLQTVTSSAAYNDGQWHHVVASLSSGGMKLYLDGRATGNTNTTSYGQAYVGYWRVGGDNLNSWPNKPSSNFFAGTIDDVATYPTALTGTQVRDHYTKSGRTLAIPAAPTDAYGKAVYAADPDFYWRLDEASGTTAADVSANAFTGVYAGGYTQQADTPVTGSTGKGVTFNGSTGTIGSTQLVTRPTVYSEELWFTTTTAAGGKLIGLGDRQTTASSSNDRHVYLENNGQVTFGAWTGFMNKITSPKSYNDGSWHHMVATQGGDGMRLYLDGILVASNDNTGAESNTGYWRVGGDTSWNGSYFAGTIDEVAVYSKVLSAAQVQQHYYASPAAVNAAPTASFTSACTGLTCAFDASASSDSDGTVAAYAWDFGDGTTGTGATVSHDYATGGTFTVKLTVTDNGGAKATKSAAVTVVKPNVAPKAVFSSAAAKLKLTVDAGDSSDADGTVASYAWDFGDDSTGTGTTASHTYAKAGTYTVKLTVTDDQGATDSATKSVTVTANAAPKAALTVTADELKITADGSTSTDADGTVASYAWDFGDDSTGTGKTATHTYAKAGSYTVKLTVTDDDGATDSAIKSVTVTKTSVLAKDTFTRTATRWGTADTGGAWTDSGGSLFSTNGSKGLMKMSSAGLSPIASLNSVSASDVAVESEFAVDKIATGGGVYYYQDARRTADGRYVMTVRVLADGSVRVGLRTLVGSTETTLKEVAVSGLSYTPGDVLHARLEVSGTGTTTLTAKVWKDGTTAPATPQVSTTDTTSVLQKAGVVGLRSYLSGSATNAPVVITVDNLSVVSLGQ